VSAPVALIGLPQPDGYVPFVFVAFGAGGAAVSAGTFGGYQGAREDECMETSRSEARRILKQGARQHSLFEVPFHEGLHFAMRAFAVGLRAPEGWEEFQSWVDPATWRAAKLLDPLVGWPQEVKEDVLQQATSILDPGGKGLVFGLPEEVAQQAMEEIFAALSSPLELDDDARRARISDAICAAADRSMEGPGRATWTLALQVSAWWFRQTGDGEAELAAWQAALALGGGRRGRDVPFIRVWTERQLAVTAEMARSMPSSPLLGS
jgi:hypothetical protein